MIYQSRDRKGAEYNRAMRRSFTVAALMKMALRGTTGAMINGVFIEHN
jgi:hypothetical protein